MDQAPDQKLPAGRATLPAVRLKNAAISVLLATPTLLVLSREIPATILLIVVLLLTAAAFAAGSQIKLISGSRNAVSSPGFIWAAGLVFLAFASVFWSPIPGRGAAHAVHFGGALFLSMLGAVVACRLSGSLSALAIGFAMLIAGLLVVSELSAGSPVRAAANLATEKYRLNRSAVAISLFLPLASALLFVKRRFVLLMSVWLVSIPAIWFSESQSAKLGLIVVLLVLPAAFATPRMICRFFGVAAILVILAAPVLAPMANKVIPQRIHESVGYGSLTIRGDIWRETAAFVWQRPFFGWGIEASLVLPDLLQADGLSDEQRFLLSWGHPHNAPLQIWLELGLVGALLAAGALAFGFRALERLPAHLLPAATTTAAAAFAIACVSHGAWQAWWWGLLGLVAVAFAAAVAPPPRESR